MVILVQWWFKNFRIESLINVKGNLEHGEHKVKCVFVLTLLIINNTRNVKKKHNTKNAIRAFFFIQKWFIAIIKVNRKSNFGINNIFIFNDVGAFSL